MLAVDPPRRYDADLVSRLVLIHRDAAVGRQRATHLRRDGHTVVHPSLDKGTDLHKLWKKPPDAFVFDLESAPSMGRDLAIMIRQRKATRNVPLVFVNGEPDKVQQVRNVLPDATFTDWRRFGSALRRALAQPLARPATPNLMSGYSGTPLPKKLGIKHDSVVALRGAPPDFEATLGPLPDKARLRRRSGGSPDVILLFLRSRTEMQRRFPAAARDLADRGRLWMAWPKRASGVATDLTPQVVRSFGLAEGFVDYKIAAIDATWSGLCFARRRPGS